MLLKKTKISQIMSDVVFNNMPYPPLDSLPFHMRIASGISLQARDEREVFLAGKKLTDKQYTLSEGWITVKADVMNKFTGKPVNVCLVNKSAITEKGKSLSFWIRPLYTVFDYKIPIGNVF